MAARSSAPAPRRPPGAALPPRTGQLFGGYGYITEFGIARVYADARVTRIYGGTSEVMKSIISKSLGL
jgi:hypothetical protein